MSMFIGKQPEDVLHPQGLLGIEFDEAIKITAVLPDSPAAKAEAKVGDRIVKLNGKSVSSSKLAHEAIAPVRAGDRVKLAVDRDGQTVELTLTAADGL